MLGVLWDMKVKFENRRHSQVASKDELEICFQELEHLFFQDIFIASIGAEYSQSVFWITFG